MAISPELSALLQLLVSIDSVNPSLVPERTRRGGTGASDRELVQRTGY